MSLWLTVAGRVPMTPVEHTHQRPGPRVCPSASVRGLSPTNSRASRAALQETMGMTATGLQCEWVRVAGRPGCGSVLRGTQEIVDTLGWRTEMGANKGNGGAPLGLRPRKHHSLDMSNACKPRCSRRAVRPMAPRSTSSVIAPSRARCTAWCSSTPRACLPRRRPTRRPKRASMARPGRCQYAPAWRGSSTVIDGPWEKKSGGRVSLPILHSESRRPGFRVAARSVQSRVASPAPAASCRVCR